MNNSDKKKKKVKVRKASTDVKVVAAMVETRPVKGNLTASIDHTRDGRGVTEIWYWQMQHLQERK